MPEPDLVLTPDALDAVAKLSSVEKGLLVDFLYKYRRNPDQPGLNIESLQGCDWWSGRINQDLRAIFCRRGSQTIVAHVDHHDPAYEWARRHKVETHERTGALQLIQVATKVVERTVETWVDTPLFAQHADDYLLSLGVPAVLLPALREVRGEEHLLQFAGSVPDDVSERLFRLADGELVTPPPPIDPEQPIAAQPSLQQSFYVVESDRDLNRALAAPLERWITFLHPSQRFIAQGTFSGPVKVSGSAGTGKTVVLLHRARHLARQGKRVLLTTYTKALCRNLETQLGKLCDEDERARVTVSTVLAEALRLARLDQPWLRAVEPQQIENLIAKLQPRLAADFSAAFAYSEWQGVVQAQGITEWNAYRDAKRTGRGKALSVIDRKQLWALFAEVRRRLDAEGRADWPELCHRAGERLSAHPEERFDAVLVDEAQDLTTAAMQMVFALCAEPGLFMLAGDSGQRIYPGGYSLSRLGIEIRGRSRILKVNYRTTEEIRRLADRLLGSTTDDLDGGSEKRGGTRSLLSGPEPELHGYATVDEELRAVSEKLQRWIDGGLELSEIGVFARSNSLLKTLSGHLERASLPYHRLKREPTDGKGTALGTMHIAKGLEYKAVILIGVRAGQIPNDFVLQKHEDPLDREQALARERHLLYVAMTRARDALCITWHGMPSPFLEELMNVETRETMPILKDPK